MIPVPRRTELVLPARKANEVTGSRIGSSGSIGDGRCRGSASTRCSDTQMDSIPLDSASRARSRSISRVVYGPEFAEQTPIFIGIPRCDSAPDCPADTFGVALIPLLPRPVDRSQCGWTPLSSAACENDIRSDVGRESYRLASASNRYMSARKVAYSDR